MAALVLLIPQILAAIPVTTSAITATVKWIESIRAAAQQSGEWTPEAENAFQAYLIGTWTDPKWMTDAERAAQAKAP